MRGRLEVGTYKIGDSGLLEGKCALCGVYVIKGATKFGERAVVCPDCKTRAEKITNPYQATPGKR
jgi:hypothetical protein